MDLKITKKYNSFIGGSMLKFQLGTTEAHKNLVNLLLSSSIEAKMYTYYLTLHKFSKMRSTKKIGIGDSLFIKD